MVFLTVAGDDLELLDHPLDVETSFDLAGLHDKTRKTVQALTSRNIFLASKDK